MKTTDVTIVVVTESPQRPYKLPGESSEPSMTAPQARSELLEQMSHELRTPLNIIIGFSELMLDGVAGEVNEEQQQCLNDILSSGRQLLHLVDDILNLPRIESAKMELKPWNFPSQRMP